MVWRVNSIFFYLFIIDIFFNFIIQYWVDCELNFMIYFGLLFIRLSWFYDSGRVFCELSRVNSGLLLYNIFRLIFFQFQSLTISLLKIDIYNLFWFTFYKIITISWPWLRVWQVNLGWDSHYFFCLLSMKNQNSLVIKGCKIDNIHVV